MSDYSWNDFSEPAGLDPWDDMWFEEPEEEEDSELDLEPQDDFGWFGMEGLRD
jgi:hypothetical protein